MDTQVQLCQDLDFIQADQAQELLKQCSEVARMINGLLKATKPKAAKTASQQAS